MLNGKEKSQTIQEENGQENTDGDRRNICTVTVKDMEQEHVRSVFAEYAVHEGRCMASGKNLKPYLIYLFPRCIR